MSAIRWLQLLAVSQLISALTLPGAYTFPFRTLDAVNKLSPTSLLGYALSISLVVVPALSVFALLRQRKFGLWGLYFSPFLLLTFGLSAVPFLALIAPTGIERTIVAAIINAVALLGAIVLGRRAIWRPANA